MSVDLAYGDYVKIGGLTSPGGKLLNGPNDLWIRPDGNLYFTDPLYKRD